MKYKINENIRLVKAQIKDLREITNFQDDVINNMERKDFFTPLTKEEIVYPLENNGTIYMLFDKEIMIGLFILTINPPQEIIEEYKLYDNADVAILDSIMIDKNYRGFGLQCQGMKIIYNDAKKLNVKKIVATVHPENIYSSRNFDILGYKAINEITIHGGKRLIYCIEV